MGSRHHGAATPRAHNRQPAHAADRVESPRPRLHRHGANRVWLADLTYIPTDEGWLYLAAVMDLFSRKLVGWAMRDHLRTDLVATALMMAIQRQQPPVGRRDPNL